MSKAPIRIGIPPGKRALFIERVKSVLIETGDYDEIIAEPVYRRKLGYWIIPIATNTKGTLGDFLYLYDNGKIERVTIRPDDDNVTYLVKPEDN